MTMRKIRLDAAIATRAGIKSCGNIRGVLFMQPNQIDRGPSGFFGFQSKNGFGRELSSRSIKAEFRSAQKNQPRSSQMLSWLLPRGAHRVQTIYRHETGTVAREDAWLGRKQPASFRPWFEIPIPRVSLVPQLRMANHSHPPSLRARSIARQSVPAQVATCRFGIPHRERRPSA